MLDEFRALGGVAENIRLAEGAFGRGLFPIDPSEPIHINIPEDLLVSFEHVVIENDVFGISPASAVGARGRAFLEAYERDFGWGPGHLELERFLAAMHELPERVRVLLISKLGLARFFNPVSPELVKKWFFGTRYINFRGRQVVMPIVEMANHGGTAKYDLEAGVGLHGVFNGEVLVRYCPITDPLDMFLNWAFSAREPVAFSLGIRTTYAGKPLEIRRNFTRDLQAPFIPRVGIENGEIVLDYLLLGHQQFPRLPKGAFRRALAPMQLADPDELYDFLQFANRQDFLELLNVLEGIDCAATQPLRRLALNQLGALSWHIGVKPL
jgi:hypothetical protein